VCQNAGGAKLLSLEEAQDKYKQVGPMDLPKYHTVIDIPDIKKKKNKDKEKTKNNVTNSNNLSNTVNTPSLNPINSNASNNMPINLQIQQQFETLQSSNQITPSMPLPIISSTSTANSANNTNNNTNNGSSSPAFKSLFRNLRVGSVKYQQSPSVATSGSAAALAGLSSNTPNNLAQPNNNLNQQTPLNSLDNESLKQTNLSTATPFLPSMSSSNSTSLIRTSSTSTFKPPPVASSTIGITSSSNSDIKSDFNNCISQLQSNAALALMSSSQHNNSNITSFTGCLSPNTNNGNNNQIPSSTGSVLLRTNKLNQSQHSIHSNILNQNNNNNNTVQLTTFSPSANVEMRKGMFF
jgi:hypothetical protein